MNKKKWNSIFDYGFLVLLLALVVGNPLIFGSLTRSLFEVYKLLLLRIITLVALGLWLFKYNLFSANNAIDKSGESWTVFGIRWQIVGLESFMVAWIVLNLISTIFSQNVRISIIGAYDRWEGIITVINYVLLVYLFAKLVTERFQLNWIIGGLLVSTAISATYGVFQSLGMDFMNWFMDISARVAGTINNPVHYCAYMGMIVPVGLGWLMYSLSEQELAKTVSRRATLLHWMVLFVISVVYYAQILSYSRATWIAFVGALTLFYLLVNGDFRRENVNYFIIDFFLSAVAIAVFYLIYIFHFYQKNIWLAMGLFFILGCYVIYSFFAVKKNLYRFLGRFLIILIFGELISVAISWIHGSIYFGALIIYHFLVQRDNDHISQPKKIWLSIYLFLFGFILLVPIILTTSARWFEQDDSFKFGVLNNVEKRISSYEEVSFADSARTSMWKSSIPLIKKYWLIGTGPDTVRYMFPLYRRPEYGSLEGSYKITPDRLHNEYLNTLATRGVFGFLIYYLGIILGWYLLVLKGLYRLDGNPYMFLLSGIMAGASVYLGQVMFNFGVVATLVLFYVLMGLGMTIINHKTFLPKN